ncbi:hypothetical protein N7486_001177 [Penicillium sp. IBT 16267x]|nr:hypothetical protein N7486_001177 [Penicillium sp. IBT 16267x]
MLQEMASRGKPKVNIRDYATVSDAGSLAIMAAVIEVQSSHIMELESRIIYQARSGLHMDDFSAGYYLNSRYPMQARPAPPSSAADSASPGVHRYPRSVSPSSEEDSVSAGVRNVVGGLAVTPEQSSEDPASVKDCLSTAFTEDGTSAKEWTGRPDGPVVKEPVEVLTYEESVVEAVQVSVYEESIAKNFATEEPVTEGIVGEERVEVLDYEGPVPNDPTAEELAWEEPAIEVPVPWEPVAEEYAWEESATQEPAVEEPVPEQPVAELMATETNHTHPLLPNSHLYNGWKDLSPKQRRARTKKLKREGLPIPDQHGVISLILA